MKKSIQKPQNWQDFESLCKRLWGEMWNIPHKIKKNGRSGQPQAGVDVYGIPSGENHYWGIQCKGKDGYSKSKLTESEINKEIENAKSFVPPLKVFIFATTANKDVEIEEYVRVKDKESRENGGFEILIFCWEDIADFIEENRATFNYYVNEQQFQSKYDFTALLNEFQEKIELKPKFQRTIKRYILKKQLELIEGVRNQLKPAIDIASRIRVISPYSEEINHSVCKFDVVLTNTGNQVIEDWKFILTVDGSFVKLSDYNKSNGLEVVSVAMAQNRNTYCEGNQIWYLPRNGRPLVQKDNRSFEVFIQPKCQEYQIPIRWSLIARNYNKEGIIYLNVIPDYDDRIIYQGVESKKDILEDEILSIEDKNEYVH